MRVDLPQEAIDAMQAVAPDVSSAAAENMLRAALGTGEVMLARCSCPVGWGQVRDANCPTHRAPAHTVTGAEVEGTVQHRAA